MGGKQREMVAPTCRLWKRVKRSLGFGHSGTEKNREATVAEEQKFAKMIFKFRNECSILEDNDQENAAYITSKYLPVCYKLFKVFDETICMLTDESFALMRREFEKKSRSFSDQAFDMSEDFSRRYEPILIEEIATGKDRFLEWQTMRAYVRRILFAFSLIDAGVSCKETNVHDIAYAISVSPKCFKDECYHPYNRFKRNQLPYQLNNKDILKLLERYSKEDDYVDDVGYAEKWTNEIANAAQIFTHGRAYLSPVMMFMNSAPCVDMTVKAPEELKLKFGEEEKKREVVAEMVGFTYSTKSADFVAYAKCHDKVTIKTFVLFILL